MSPGGVQSAAGSRSFDFGYDDLLCSFEDYTLQLDPTANGKRFDSSVKDLHWSRAMRHSANVNGRPKEFLIEDVVYTVEKCMKKHADNLTMHLEGISGRLTQLELYCYKLERSIGEFRTDMIHDQSEAYLKLKSLDKHVHEVHRSVQIIRDKQELYETQIELTKLQFSQKDSANLSHSPKNNEDINAATSKNKANFEVPNQKLTLDLPNSSSSPPSVAISPVKNHPEKQLPVQHSPPVSLSVPPKDHYVPNQVNEYYYAHHQPLIMEQHSQNLQSELHYTQQRVKMHDLSIQEPPKQEQRAAANQFTQKPPFPQHPQHWSLLPALYSTAPQSDIFGGSTNTISHLPPQHDMPPQQASPHCCYVGTSTYPPQSNLPGYNAVYVIDGNRASHLPSYHLGSYPPNGNVAASLISSNHPYGAVGIVLGTAESG